MSKTIDTMKQGVIALTSQFGPDIANALSLLAELVELAEAIKREEAQPKSFAKLYSDNAAGIEAERLAMEAEAQTVGLVDDLYLRGELMRSLSCWHRLTKDESDQLVALFADHAIPHSEPDEQSLSGEREDLVSFLRGKYDKGSCGEIGFKEAADMLAADAVEIDRLECDYTDQVLRAITAEDKLTQAAQVPMADGEIKDVMAGVYAKENYGRDRLEYAFARAIEAHHGIKP